MRSSFLILSFINVSSCCTDSEISLTASLPQVNNKPAGLVFFLWTNFSCFFDGNGHIYENLIKIFMHIWNFCEGVTLFYNFAIFDLIIEVPYFVPLFDNREAFYEQTWKNIDWDGNKVYQKPFSYYSFIDLAVVASQNKLILKCNSSSRNRYVCS